MADIFELFRKIAPSGAAAGPLTHLVVGLGNPGPNYTHTRHNVGFMALDHLAAGLGVRIDRARFRALTAEAAIDGVRALLMKPETFMNLSGEAVAEAASFYKIPPENILVLCDDVNFEVGRIRIRRKGSHGGHNGLRNITACLGSEAFPRIRIGVGQKPTPEYDLADWVLGRFPAADETCLAERFGDTDAAVRLILSGRVDEAMNRYSK